MRFTILTLLLCLNVFSQRETSNWYFGLNAGINFNSGIPVPLTNGQINTIEGCSSISDELGNLLFYTDGKSIWDRNHNLMPNGSGLFGSFSSTQSGIIIPNPVNPNLYYIFTSDSVQAYQIGTGDGLNYTVVDMSQNGGLGDVLSGQKNVNLLPNSSEKISSAISYNGDYFWVVTHYQNKLYSYKVDEFGINNAPVISSFNTVYINDFNNIRGAIKLSPDGTKLAITHSIFEPNFDGYLLLYDFNAQTGVISNEILIDYGNLFYGVEFSSKSSKLYASLKTINGNVTGNIQIIQYDLLQSNIPNSKFIIHDALSSSLGDLSGALQIAIDKKIYHSSPGYKLSVIRTPNLSNINSDFRFQTIDLNNRVAQFGLPPFIQTYFENFIDVNNLCLGIPTEFSLDTSASINSVLWNFDDPTSGSQNTSNLLNPSHLFTTPGIYEVTLEIDFIGRPNKTYINFIEISPSPPVIFNAKLIQCDTDGNDDGITLFNLNEAIENIIIGDVNNFTANFFETLTYAQQNINSLNEIGYQNTTNNQIIYARVFENSECFVIVPLTLIVESTSLLPEITSGVCSILNGLSVTIKLEEILVSINEILSTTNPISLFNTNNDALLEQFQLDEPLLVSGLQPVFVYYRIENDNDCISIGKFNIDIILPTSQEIEIEMCQNDISIILDPGDQFDSYEWNIDGNPTDQTISVSNEGSYTVNVYELGGCNNKITFNVIIKGTLEITSIIIDDFSSNSSISIQINDLPFEVEYSVDNGITFQESNFFNNMLPGDYQIIVRGLDGCSLINKNISIGNFPSFFTPNNDGFNDYWKMENGNSYSNATIYIYDRFGKLIKKMKGNQKWDGFYNGRIHVSSDYWYSLELENGRKVTGHFSLIR